MKKKEQSVQDLATGVADIGIVALLAQWALIERNDIGMDTNAANKYLIRGAQRQGMLNVPNRTWGNGTLDIYGVFDSLRPR